MGLPLLTENSGSKICITMTWAVYDGDVFYYAGSSLHPGVENDCMVEKPGLLGHGMGPD